MAKIAYKYEFVDEPMVFLRSNSTSTDALNALTTWKNGHEDRQFDVCEDQEHRLVAKVTWPSSDDTAANDLIDQCVAYRLAYNFMGECDW